VQASLERRVFERKTKAGLRRSGSDIAVNRTIRRHAPFWLSLAVGIGMWELVGRNTSQAFMVPFSETLVRLWQLVRSGDFLAQLLDSAELFLTGFVIAVAVGAPLGLLLARVRALRVGIEPYIMILYATPMVALIPFILSIMGFGFAPKVLVVFLFAVFPVLYNTIEGARSIRPELIEVAKSFRSREWALWREVMLPYTLPFIMTGIRQAIGRALVGMVAAEFFLSSTGLGQLIMGASQNFDTGGVFASIFVIGLIGVALMRAGLMIEQHFARWRQ
jgi:ABC-type nitrate/sulfonate/bicarbonate transport system permease component